MWGKQCFLLMLQFVWLSGQTQAQHSSPFSLQAAVDELHRREAAKYPLNSPPSQQHYLSPVFGAGEDYWDEDTDFPASTYKSSNNRHKLNKALAKYLERENYDAEHGGLKLGPFGGYEFDEDNNNFFNNYPEEKKRSFFREMDKDAAPSSIFRERETETSNGPELAGEFLREIEEAQEREREERYKDALRRLWDKYQEQENDIEGGELYEQKKRLRTPPYYMLMQKKRSAYPVLPWLPVSERSKRFPVAKRSTKRSTNENVGAGKTNEKVAKELSELFGPSVDEKKKRSVDSQTKLSDISTTTTATNDSNKNHNSKVSTSTTNAAGVQNHSQTEHKHHKRSEHNSHESPEEDEHEEESEEHEEHEEHDEEDCDEDEHEEFEEEEEEERKKKRDVSSVKQIEGKELIGNSQAAIKDQVGSRRKKSIQWSKYFGLDRKKKSFKSDSAPAADVKKRSASDDRDEDVEKKKRDLDPEKIENMDRKLQSIEDFIIDETIKYTGAHEGIANPEEVRRLKDHVLSRLATAYSLEKMRRALDKLRQSIENENHLLRNVIESEESNTLDPEKRLSVKKEKPSEHNDMQHNDLHANAMMSAATKNSESNENNDEDMKKKKKKKRNGYLRYPEQPNDMAELEQELGAGRYETLNDAYLGNKNYIIGSNQCPIIEAMAERCRGVDLLSGDVNQELLPICGVHQICYLCSTTPVACDYQYLTEADSICGNNNDCQATARSVLMILRGTPGPQLGPRECFKNSCLNSAMREIGL